MSDSPEVRVAGAEPIVAGACRVIAEAGANHNNSVDRAIEMAQKAADAGAWGCKYQLYKAGSLTVKDSPKYWTDAIGTKTQHEAFELSDRMDYGDYAEVAAACREMGIVFFATPFDLDAVEALEKMDVPAHKIASADITHKRLLEAVAETNKPVFLATGASTLDEVKRAVDWMGLGPDKLVLLACTLTYPTPDPDGHFARIETYKREMDPYLIGMSDHTIGSAGAWMTAALGGVCIEKHYTIDPDLPDVPDHKLSVTPPELAEMVQACNRAAVLRGDPWIGVRDSEQPARQLARRSIVLERDVVAGQPLTLDDLGFKRPGTGMAPFDYDRVIGRALKDASPAGTVLTEEALV